MRNNSAKHYGGRRSAIGLLLECLYKWLPARHRWLQLISQIEGGEFQSVTLRRILKQHHGVQLGLHSYGSLARPGMADPGTYIGNYVSIGPNVRRLGANHPLNRPSLHPYWFNPRLGFVRSQDDVERTECWIEHDAWVGANVTILPNCRRIGIGATVGAGTVVTKDVGDFEIVAGNPARHLGYRMSPSMRSAVLQSRFWENDSPHEVADVLGRIEQAES